MHADAPYAEWIGRSEHRHDILTPGPVAALAATLDRDDPPPRPGDALPPLWHWLYFLPLHRHSELGPDGHARRGDFLPPVPLPRRMWAGGRLNFVEPLRIGEPVQRFSRITAIRSTRGRSGELVFVTVRHEIHHAGRLALEEEHDIVYREAPRPEVEAAAVRNAPTQAAPHAVHSRTIRPDSVLLFRYSALTFNGHRIHYDRAYATEVEGYPGLVVHGPLIATLLLDLLRREHPSAHVRRFGFRALRPLFDIHPFSLHAAPPIEGSMRLWATDHEGTLAMTAAAHVS
ncbi:MAG: acyl-CoA dehydrogenase [Caldimonas sp.]|uniref:FAS1-like dehydratase domain-containing protein n=1 Tax=Caldimonas taiwanensis TaxID=307483 RepID=UPI0007862874|nr:MaoC family dehydratase N-terminal domain-containing protein [Caldimonas taiwanensis]GIX25669.1 MAG: acyl-CoA dehydrogenase [Caldimonas sp.]